jgi:sugar phosphate isomerase/epimerase
MKYGVQMYSIKPVASEDLRAALKAVADLGYKTVEFAGFFDKEASDVRAWLDEYGLEPIATHTGLVKLDADNIAATAEYHKAIGCDHIVVPSANWASLEGMEASIAGLNFAAKFLADYGITVGFHNHSGEFHTQAYGKMPMTEIIERTDVAIEPDVFWLFNAGVDPVEFLEKNKARIRMIHMKDGIVPKDLVRTYKNPHEGAKGTAVGEGETPAKAICEWAQKNDVSIIVECEAKSADGGIDDIRRSIEFLRSLEQN